MPLLRLAARRASGDDLVVDMGDMHYSAGS